MRRHSPALAYKKATVIIQGLNMFPIIPCVWCQLFTAGSQALGDWLDNWWAWKPIEPVALTSSDSPSETPNLPKMDKVDFPGNFT